MESSTIYWVLLPLLFSLLLFSSFFSASETAITSLNVIRLKQMAKSNSSNNINKNKQIRRAKKVYRLVKDYERTLATILIANTLINTALATIGALLFSNIIKNDQTATWVATAVVGVVVLIFGEIVPKTIAKQFPEKFAIFSSYILIFWKIVLWPFIWFVGIKKKNQNTISTTESELLELIQTIEKEGVLERNESQLIESAITFDEKTVDYIMQPKDKVLVIPNDIEWLELKKIYKEERFTRMPVIDPNTNQVTGIINIKDILIALIDKKEVKVKDLQSPPTYIAKHVKLDDALELLQQEQVHMAIVTPHKDSTEFLGVITLEDVIEELVGEIYDEDDITGSVKEIGHHMFWIRGDTPLKKVFKKHLLLSVPPKTTSKTLYDWYHEMLKTKVEDHNSSKDDIEYNGYLFTINKEKTTGDTPKNTIFEIEMLTKYHEKDEL